MSTSVKTADLAITIIVSLLKAAGLGPEADRILDAIEGAKDCIGLIEDIKNETVSDPNKELIRSLFKAIKEEVRSIRANLKDQGREKDEIESTVDALIETTRLTVKQLAQDDDALLDAARLPDSFFKILVHRAEPLPDWCDDTTETLYEKLLRRVSAEFVGCAHNFDRFDKVALISLLRDSLSAKMQMNRIEHGVQEDRAINLETNRVVKKLAQQHLSSTPSCVFFGSRPDVVAGERFVERDEHEQLKKVITDPKRDRTVLLGMRGCGKTQLAASLAKQCEDANWNLVAWINAVSRESIQSDLVELAKQLQIDTSDLDDQDIIVRRCLRHLWNAPAADRLIVFDNVEDIEDLRDRIPRGTGLRVVATTTSREADWEENGWKGISVGVFSRVKSIKYLLNVTGSQDRDTADAIGERLGDLPLAIAQAAATARNEQWTLAIYARRLESSCGEEVIRRIRGHYYSDAVSVALRMATDNTLKRLEDSLSDAARRQLRALCLLAESGVPTHWLDPAAASALSGSHDAELDTAAERAHRALIALINASIIHQSADGSTTMLHRLQAQALRESWREEEREQACESAATLLGSVDIDRFRADDSDARFQETRNLIEHLRAFGAQDCFHCLHDYRPVTSALCRAFTHARDLGLVPEVFALKGLVNTLRKQVGDSREILSLLAKLAYADMYMGDYPDAIKLYKHILSTREQILEPNHRDILSTRNDLAYAYYWEGNTGKAIDLFEQVLDDRTRILRSDHEDMLMTGSYLALAYADDGQLERAITLGEQVVKDRDRVLKPDHKYTLVTRNNLADAYKSVGRLTDAIKMYEYVLEARIRTLGNTHHHTRITRNDLAQTYEQAGDLPKAISMYEDLHNDYIQMYGPDHESTIEVRDRLEAAKHELEQQEKETPDE